MSQDVVVELARHDERLADLEEWRDKQNEALDDIRKELKKLSQTYFNRPTWAVTVLIGILSTVCGSMAVFIVTHL